MKKIFKVVILAAIAAACAAIAACAGEPGPEEQGKPNVFWDEVSGAENYDIYAAASRFGAYTLLASGLERCEYFDPGYSFENYYKVEAVAGGETVGVQLVGGEAELFGENVYILSPKDDPVEVQALIDDLYEQQEEAHFTSRRYAVFFKPGNYADGIDLSVGYYTTFAGLGRKTEAVSVMRMRCTDTWNTNALINFWRGAENLTVRNDLLWAVSQGVSLRGIGVNGDASLWHTGASSGGFMANCSIKGTVYSGSQQQWIARNSSWQFWNGALWNMVFLGNEPGCSPSSDWEEEAWNTVVEETPVIREKPYLIFENGAYSVFVPSLRTDAAGLYDPSADAAARIIPLDEFFVAKQGDTAQELNAALATGKHLFFTPGVYELSEPLRIIREGTVVLGTGLATLVPENREGCMIAETAEGITVAGILFDAKDSEYLLKVGAEEASAASGEAPALLADCYFRVGGASDEATRVDICLLINADGVVCDNLWTWRADHGYRWRESENSLAGVGWDVNRANTGVAVYGDGVTAYGLFSEHFQGHNVYWAGEDGNVVFFQSEVAYDIPSSEGGGDSSRFISFLVDGEVTTFTATAFGIYTHFWNGGIAIDCAVSVPESGGITLKNVVAIALSTNNDSHLVNVINETGGAVGAGSNQKRILSYSAG